MPHSQDNKLLEDLQQKGTCSTKTKNTKQKTKRNLAIPETDIRAEVEIPRVTRQISQRTQHETQILEFQ